MGKIIVGVDFSKGSDLATELAIDIAKHFNDSLQFVGVNEGKLSEEKLWEEIHNHETQHIQDLNGLTLEYLPKTGEITDAICEQAKKEKASLVIVGSNVTAGLQKRLLGQGTYSIIDKSLSPVLCLREDFDYHSDFKDILLPIDSSDESRQKVPMAIRFAKAYGSTIHVLGVNKTSVEEGRAIVKNYATQTKNYIEKLGITCTLEIKDVVDSVSATILAYAHSVCADLLIMMAECGMSMIRFVTTSDDQKTLAASKIPIITVRPEQLNTITI